MAVMGDFVVIKKKSFPAVNKACHFLKTGVELDKYFQTDVIKLTIYFE